MNSNRFVRTAGTLAIVLACVTAAGDVFAQQSGIRLGAGVVRPTLNLGGEYQTNVNRGADLAGDTNSKPVSDFILKVRPELLLALPSQAVVFMVNGGIGYDRYLGISESSTKNFSNLNASGGVDLTLNPRGAFSFTLNDVVSRSDDPAANSLNARQGRIFNRAGALLDMKPGGGALSFQLGYSLEMTRYDGTTLDFLNSTQHNLGFQASWKFLPRTAFILAADLQIPDFPDATGSKTAAAAGDEAATATDQAAGDEGAETTTVTTTVASPTVMPIKVRLGLLGQMTTALQMKLFVGYGNALASGTGGSANYQSVLAQAEGTYYFSREAAFNLGYTRGFTPQPLYGFMGSDEVYAGVNFIFVKRVKAAVRGGFVLESYGDIDTTLAAATGLPAGARSDKRIYGAVPIEIGILRYLSGVINYSLEKRISTQADQEFLANTIYFGLKASY